MTVVWILCFCLPEMLSQSIDTDDYLNIYSHSKFLKECEVVKLPENKKFINKSL